MLTRETEIINKLGLHARSPGQLTQLAGRLKCEVWMKKAVGGSTPRASWGS